MSPDVSTGMVRKALAGAAVTSASLQVVSNILQAKAGESANRGVDFGDLVRRRGVVPIVPADRIQVERYLPTP